MLIDLDEEEEEENNKKSRSIINYNTRRRYRLFRCSHLLKDCVGFISRLRFYQGCEEVVSMEEGLGFESVLAFSSLGGVPAVVGMGVAVAELQAAGVVAGEELVVALGGADEETRSGSVGIPLEVRQQRRRRG